MARPLTACQTSGVAFHNDFWVVVGTAAPVIALAAVVTSGQTDEFEVRALERYARLVKEHPQAEADEQAILEIPAPEWVGDDRWAVFRLSPSWEALTAAMYLTPLAVALEVIAFVMAVLSLSSKRDVVWMGLAMAFITTGFIMLVFVSYFLGLRAPKIVHRPPSQPTNHPGRRYPSTGRQPSWRARRRVP